MHGHRLAVVVAWFGMIATAHAEGTAPLTISGKYTSNRGATTLVQDGTRVMGAYRAHGEIDGELDGDTLRFTWREYSNIGRGVMLVTSDGALIGTWGTGSDDHDGGSWRLTPVIDPPATAVIATALAAPVKHAGTWSFGIRFPWDVTLLSGSTAIGLGGMSLAARRVG